MGSRYYESYSLKLTSLHDYYQRLLHGSQPLPSGLDIANILKFFSQTLLALLKEVREEPFEMIKSQKFDGERMALYPSLDYRQLYNALTQLIDVVPLLHLGLQAFGKALLQCLACLLPFLDHDLIDNLSYLTASTISVLPMELHEEIVNYLCFYILPLTITRRVESGNENAASQSIAAVIMMVFQYSNNPAHHCQLLECLMALKPGVVKDILCVVAYGTAPARASAAKLLFYYWPSFNPNLFDRRAVLVKFASERHKNSSHDLTPFVCQRDNCPNAGNAEAAKVCYDHRISITFANESPPPLYLCIECANEIHREHPNQMFYDILHPMQQVSMVCENKNCRAADKSAISICFSTECASYNGNHPIRYCQQCHNIRHNNRRGGDHVYHLALPHISQLDPQTQTYMVQAIVSLLKEAEPLSIDSNRDTTEMSASTTSKAGTGFSGISGGSAGIGGSFGHCDPTSLEERQLLGRYGVWLLVGLCTPNEDTPVEILGRLLSMLFHWFHVTAYCFDGIEKRLIHLIFSVGQAESALEKLKTEHVCGWLSQVMKTHYEVFISCLLPHPADYVRVGGHWETLASRTSHLKDGLHRLFCLVPYEVITPDVWDYVMPHWMEAVVNDVPEHELHELKIILSKILDRDMNSLGFDVKKMYNFVAKRFVNTSAKVQEQALHWLQTLTLLEITIPLEQLFAIFSDGVTVMQSMTSAESELKPSKPTKENDENTCSIVENDSGKSTPLSDDVVPTPRHMEFMTNAELNLSCCILMLDILLKQMELQNVDKHTGINTAVCRDACHLMKSIVASNWNNGHMCASDAECTYCESRVIWHQLCLQLITYMAPENPAYPPDMIVDESADDQNRKNSPEKKGDSKPDVVLNMPVPEMHSVGGVLVHMPHFFEQIMTATVETVSEQLDLAAIMPTEKVMSAVVRTVTLSETDLASATASVAKTQLIAENDEPTSPSAENDLDDFWHTSVGKFRFTIEELPEQLQYIHKLLKEIMTIDKPDILYYMLQCLNVMCLYGDAFNVAVKDHQGFFIWCQENLLIKNLWELLNAEHSHIAQVTVPLLLHCVTLPCGMDTFWRLVQEEFHNSDWRVRFVAVERVTLIARFMDSTPLRNMSNLQAALANAFCYLITSMDDSNVYVAQRATLYLGTIHDTAIRSLILCLETQFDSVIVDRPMVLQSLYQLHNSLSDRRILTWEFFLNRFDTLYLEAQINLEKSGEGMYLRDLKNTDMNSEVFLKKLHRAHEALSQSDGSGTSSVKTLSASFGTKWPYKRTMSAPASMVPRQDTKQEKEKVYSRQYSAPILKRKSSRFGLGQLLGFTPPPNNSIPDGHLHSLNMVDESSTLPGNATKIVDLEEADKETMHLLVFLLMQFLSRQDQAYPTDEKPLLKTQSIVLRHLYLLLGYNQNERIFHISPQRLRLSAVFNVFIANLPQLLDQNHVIGWTMTPPVLAILQHCPCPPQSTPPTDHQPPNYSLWYLEPHIRRSWLMSLLVILYKCQYGQQPWCNQLQSLVKIVLNTLDTQHHQCKRIPATVVMDAPPSRSRDVSQPSLGVEHDGLTTNAGELETETPPMRTSMHQRSPGAIHGQMETHWEENNGPASRYFNKHFTSHSINADDTESELAAIPESPKSDSTLHGSSGGSLGELEDTVFKHTLHEPRMSITDGTTGATEPNNRNAVVSRARAGSVTKPMWFIGNEDEAYQGNKSGPSKKWGVYEGMKMMVTGTFMTGQEPPKPQSKISAPTAKNGKRQLPYNGDNVTKSFDLSGAFAVATSISHIQRPEYPKEKGKEKEKEKEKKKEKETEREKEKEKEIEKEKEKAFAKTADTVNNNESTNAKHLGRQKYVEQITITATSPVSPCQVISVTNSDHSSSPALSSSISSQIISTENGQQSAIPQPLMTTPTVERLLPIGTMIRATGSRAAQRVLRCEDAYGSPESPLSKMDVLTVSSSFEQDSETCMSSDITSPHSISQLEFPTPERLLPVGPQRDFSSLVDRVCQALDITDVEAISKSSDNVKPDTHETVLTKQDSGASDNMSASLVPTCNEVNSSRSPSPRRLIKQVALESSPPAVETGDFASKVTDYEQKIKSREQFRIQRDRGRKTLTATTDQNAITHARRTESWSGAQVEQNSAYVSQQACHADFNLKHSLFRIGNDCVYDRCSECGTIKEEYSDEELGLCIITLGTFIHREPSLAAPLLPEILSIVTKVALNAMYPWQSETNIHLPGGAISVAHQFLRCVLHQLAPNGIFTQMFQTHLNESTRLQFFKSVAQALVDFNELNPIAPLQLLLETLNMKKSLPLERLPIILYNIACYLDCLPLEAGLGPGSVTWSALLTQFDGLFRRLVLILPSIEDINPLLRIMVSLLKVPGIQQAKGMLDPFSKILSYAIQNSTLQYHYLTDLCYLCHRGFIRDRDKHFFGRTIVFELIQAIKFKTTIPDSNFLLLLQFVLQDIGGSLPNTLIAMDGNIQTDVSPIYNTNASESLKNQLSDVLDFLGDFHTLSKIKSYSKGMQAGLNEDTIGGTLKCGLAQYVALEITRGNNRENRAVARYLPWLYIAPTIQQGFLSTVSSAREYVDCIGHIRLLSWLLLGSLTHIAMYAGNNNNNHAHSTIQLAQPIPQEVSCHIADHIQIIFSGFPEQSKTSVLHMSSLFYAFILCQLWTMYLEELSKNNATNSESHNVTLNILLEFWSKITPCILQLVSYSKALSEMLNLHFLSLLEALLECGSIVLNKLLPLWNAILFSHHVQLPGHLQVRLQNCRDFPPSRMAENFVSNRRESNAILLRWLHRLQFKMGQIEMQSSNATQFYSI
ncbi:protein unc-79 homolog isoform X3 [Pseudomyrmex gracilis]|uniref:protein unc-79 homolog isoform X3 n=1 Tax=Pseudomyrmex gracilis TaxID=219809 RepID=UPI000994ED59|nr:protein unc-79 homolog isoform X3 [Pseudomyrmex gracilis]